MLSFNRRERNGIIILMVLLGLLILSRLLIPLVFEPELPDPSDFAKELKSLERDSIPGLNADDELFMFDPNRVGIEDLLRLGLSETVSRTLIRYREKGGSFESAEDIKKIYGLGEMDYRRLEPYITIQPIIILQEIESDSLPERTHTPPEEVPSALFDLNSADTSRLMKIYGIGPVLSLRIVKYRELLGGFATTDQLSEVYGLDDQTRGKLSAQVYLDSLLIRKIDLNKAGLADLTGHPYLDAYQAGALLSYRELKGQFSDLEEILSNKLLSQEDFMKIQPYLSLDAGRH